MNHLHETCQRLNALTRDRVQFANKIYQADAELQIVASARVLQILYARWVPRVFVPKSISAASRDMQPIYTSTSIYIGTGVALALAPALALARAPSFKTINSNFRGLPSSL